MYRGAGLTRQHAFAGLRPGPLPGPRQASHSNAPGPTEDVIRPPGSPATSPESNASAFPQLRGSYMRLRLPTIHSVFFQWLVEVLQFPRGRASQVALSVVSGTRRQRSLALNSFSGQST